MAVPLKKSEELIQDLTNRLNSSLYIEDSEEFQYRLILKDISRDSMDGYLAWGLYFACRKQEVEAVNQLKKSIYFQDALSIGNYLIYLKRIGKVDEFIKQATAIKKQYLDQPDLIKEYILSAFLQGDFKSSIAYADRMVKLGYDQLSDYQNNIENFLQASKITESDLQHIIFSAKSFVQENKVSFTGIWLSCSSSMSEGHLFVGVIDYSPEELLELQVEIYSHIVKQDLLMMDQEIIVMAREVGAPMFNEFSVKISFFEGLYTAICNDLHLVTEAKDVNELQKLIWDLAPDLVDLNNLDVDVHNMMFNFQFDQSAKDYIRGH